MYKFFFSAVIIASILCSTSAFAGLYTVEYDETTLLSSITEDLDVVPAGDVITASAFIKLAGRTYKENSSNYWQYESIVDVYINGTLRLNDYSLPYSTENNAFVVLDFVLNQDDIDKINIENAISFSIEGQSAYWNSGTGEGYTTSRFYLDYVQLDSVEGGGAITQDLKTAPPVPAPGAFFLLGAGCIACARLKKYFV